jgi:nitroimidazol reductase NimA-like FMN-containing flavoprotein (pyridoxamine 5'-phosphate oxidase superfamily)
MEARASRPHMPGYGILPPDEGTGLLTWQDAEARFAAAQDYWLATTWPDCRPHVMPVWGVWDSEALWFSSSVESRKIANLRRDPRCVVATEDAVDPVIMDGVAKVISDEECISWFLNAMNSKYSTDYGPDFLDPTKNATVRIEPETAFALLGQDFTGSPTRWRF